MENQNPLMCDPETGMCEIQDTSTSEDNLKASVSEEKKIRIIYFTDPICSSCWGIEPQLKKMKLEYGIHFTLEYHMGGLLPSWDGYNGGGIKAPSDVAAHWDEASHYYQMPIDGDVWLENPLASSYPPSIAFKAAQIQNEESAIIFLRIMREMLFLQKRDIDKWEYLEEAAKKAGLDTDKLKTDYEGVAKQLFHEDLSYSRRLGVRGFPTLFFYNNNQRIVVSGSKPYAAYEDAIVNLYPGISKKAYLKDAFSLVILFRSMTSKELSVLTDVSVTEAEKQLSQLHKEGKLDRITSKNGSLWVVKPN